MPRLRMALDRFQFGSSSPFVHPRHQLIHILYLLILERMKGLACPLSLQFLAVLHPHVNLAWKGCVACQNRGCCYSLEFEERECRCEVRHSNEEQRGIWDVEDVFVEVVHLCTIGNEDSIIRLAYRHLVVVIPR